MFDNQIVTFIIVFFYSFFSKKAFYVYGWDLHGHTPERAA